MKFDRYTYNKGNEYKKTQRTSMKTIFWMNGIFDGKEILDK